MVVNKKDSSEADQGSVESRIRDAAFKLFSERGYHQTSTTEITRAAGVGKGSLYWYWTSKEDLAFSIVSEMLEFFLRFIEELRDSEGSVIERARRLVQAVADTYEQEKEYCILLWKFRADRYYIFSSEYQEKVMSYYVRIREAIADIISQGIESGEIQKVDPKFTAFIVLGVTEGLEVQWLENEDEFPIKDALITVMDVLLKGYIKKVVKA